MNRVDDSWLICDMADRRELSGSDKVSNLANSLGSILCEPFLSYEILICNTDGNNY